MKRDELLRLDRLIGDAIGMMTADEPDIAGAERKLLLAMDRINAELYPDRRISNEVRARIDEAARMRVDGLPWTEIEVKFGDSFARDLRRRYKRELQFRLGYWQTVRWSRAK